MALNFTVIFSSRQHFGKNPNEFGIPGAFVGQTKDYSFDCPDISVGETAFLLFQSEDVTYDNNVFRINGIDVYGGLYWGPTETFDTGNTGPCWTANVVLVEPRHHLQATGNVLHVESQPPRHGDIPTDEFVLDNMIIVYKAVAASGGPVTG